MAEQQDARGFMFQVLDADGLTWLEIEALTEFSVDRSENLEEAETTTFADKGQYRSQAMQRGASCELTARRKANTPAETNPGKPTVGRKRVEALGRLVGYEATGKFRFRHVWETQWEQWDAWVEVGETSGETNDKAEWECTWHLDGPPRYFLLTGNTEVDADGKALVVTP